MMKSRKVRAALFGALCLISLLLNMALSNLRQHTSGRLQVATKEDLRLLVKAGGKVEPKLQETVRAVLDGELRTVHIKEGDAVVRGQLLLEISDEIINRELLQKRSQFQNARADAEKAKKDYALEQSLFKQMAVPQRDVDNARQSYDRSLQTLKNVELELAALEKKALGVKVYAPMNGTVLKIFVENDSYVSTGKELVKVAQLGELVVRARVDELDIAKIKVGQPGQIGFDAFGEANLDAQVDWIGPQAAEGPFPEIEVVLTIADTKSLPLKPNLSAEVWIEVGRLPDALVVPAGAVRSDENGSYVLKKSAGGWLRKHPVAVGQVTAGQVVLTAGLEAGDTVLVPKED